MVAIYNRRIDGDTGGNERNLMSESGDNTEQLTEDLELHLEECQKLIKYQFQDTSHLVRALTHASSANHKLQSNERMEFLGDAVMGACICEFLFHRFPKFMEGELTRVKSVVVSGSTCARVTRRIGLDKFIIVGKGMANASTPPSLLADLFESMVAGLFLDGGWEAAKKFVLDHMKREVEQAAETTHDINYKSQLQHIAQKDLNDAPAYKLLAEAGPDHAKSFQVAVELGGKRFAPAWGNNKKQAQQRAASNALAELEGQDPPHPAERQEQSS